MIDYDWYKTLIQPSFQPPSWLFQPVWTILYILMSISLFIYIKEFSIKNKTWGYILFFVQLLLNFSWSPIFFMMKNITLALIIIILLDIVVLLNIIEFNKISKLASKLLIPYFIWIIFATYLNWGYLILN
ncbi:tryptophan-rich sensory protein [bacterium]|nr:tryptophan-rich sensory protein [bacterium]